MHMLWGPSLRPADLDDPYNRTTSPIVTGSSVVSLKTKDFVLCASDTLGKISEFFLSQKNICIELSKKYINIWASYGRMARFFDFERITKLGDNCFLGASGEMSDFQEVKDVTEDITYD